MHKWTTEVIAAHTGPNVGLTRLDVDSDSAAVSTGVVAGCKDWNKPTEYAYGMSLSLYEEDRTQEEPLIVGSPIADVFGIQVRENSAILAVADGVNWGRKPRLAARCAVHAVMDHISSNLERIQSEPNTHTISQLLLESVTRKAQESILNHHATLTTLSAAVVCEMAKPGEWGLFVVSVGDSPVYVYCPHSENVVEITVGCHPHDGARDMCMAGGTLGPSMGSQPDLSNLTVAYMPVYQDDIVFCTSDGISDNFSSKVMNVVNGGVNTHCCNVPQMKPCCDNVPHIGATLNKHQDKLREHLSAQTVAACLMNHAAEVTEQKRLFRSYCIENNIDIRREKERNPDFATRLNAAPGKLDHATIVAYQVGRHYKS